MIGRGLLVGMMLALAACRSTIDTMSAHLAGKRALVTAAAQGIGASIARAFAAEVVPL